MRHFADEVWADMARGSLPSSEAASIERHVQAGCSECSRALETWRAVTEILRREPDYEPPVHAVRTAMSLFSPGELDEAPGERPLAELVFDSFLSPAPAGLRSAERSARQLCFKRGSFYVDLRIEELPGTSKASVIGQLMRVPYDDNVSLEGLSVTLASRTDSLSSTTTNWLGEFHLEVPTEGEHNIALGVGEDFSFVVPLRSVRRRSQ